MSAPYRVEPGPMKVVAVLLRDPNPLHFDRDVVADRGLGDRLVLQGPVTAAVAYEAVRAATGRPVRTADLRFRGTALEGDVLECSVRPDAPDPADPAAPVGSVVVVVTTADGSTIAEGRVTLGPARTAEEVR